MERGAALVSAFPERIGPADQRAAQRLFRPNEEENRPAGWKQSEYREGPGCHLSGPVLAEKWRWASRVFPGPGSGCLLERWVCPSQCAERVIGSVSQCWPGRLIRLLPPQKDQSFRPEKEPHWPPDFCPDWEQDVRHPEGRCRWWFLLRLGRRLGSLFLQVFREIPLRTDRLRFPALQGQPFPEGEAG
jgi:hypothetical protein